MIVEPFIVHHGYWKKRLSICVQTLYIRQNASVIIALNLWLSNADKHKHFFKGENICACLY